MATDTTVPDDEELSETSYSVGAEPGNDGAQQGEEEPFIYDENAANLVEAFQEHPLGVKALAELCDQVIDDYEEDYEGTEVYRERVAENWKSFAGELKPKTWPFKDAANAHVPIAIENITRIDFRAFDELFMDWNVVFGVVPLGGADKDKIADILTTHGNWQIRSQIIDFKRQMHRAMLAFFFIGDVTTHSYYNERMRMNRHEVLTPDEFVIPYVLTTTMPDYSDVPHRTKILHWYRHDLEAMRDVWYDIDKVIDEKPSHDDEPDEKLAAAAAEVTGQRKPDGDGTAPYKILWYEGWMQLPSQEKARFCQIVVDPRCKHVLSLLIHEAPNWQDVQRYETQQQELFLYRQQQLQYQQALMAQQSAIATTQSQIATYAPAMGPMQQQAAQQGMEQMIATPPPPPPQPPTWMKNPDNPLEKPDAPRKDPIHLFAHGVCIEPLRGNLGLSFGQIQADYNRAADTALSQFVDSATLANIWSFIVSDTVTFNQDKDGGGIVISPGMVNRASGVSGTDIRESIIELKPEPANPQLMQLVDKFYGYGQSSAQAPAALSGEPGKSGETYRGLATRIEQATKQLSVPTRKFADEVLQQILLNNARLNAIYLPDEEIFAVQDPGTEAWQEFKVGRKMYERNYKVEIRSDLRFISKTQRIEEADEIVGFASKSPLLMNNAAFMYEAIKRSLAARGRQDMVRLLGQPPPPPQQFAPPPPQQPQGAPNQPPPPNGPKPAGVPGPGGPVQ